MKTVEAEIDTSGTVRLQEAIMLPAPRRALVTILDEEPPPHPSECAFLSEAALAVDWDRPEEDAAWAHLQTAR